MSIVATSGSNEGAHKRAIARPRVPPPPSVRLARRLPAIAALVVAFLLAAAGAAGLHVRAAVASWINQGLPEDALIVSPTRIALGPLSLGGSAVPETLYGELGRDPDVAAIAIEEALTVPARVHGSLAGRGYGSDVAVLGVDATALAWLAPEIDPGEFRDMEPLPVLAPRILLDAYNNAFAPAQGLPRLSASAFIGRTFTLEAGASSLGSSPQGPRAVTARLAGFAGRGELLGVLAPIAWVRKMNAAYDGEEARRLIVFPHSPAGAERLVIALRARGLEVSDPGERSRQLAQLDLILAAAAIVVALILGLLGATSSAAGAAALILARREEAELLHQLAEPRGAIIRHFARMLAGPVTVGAAWGTALGMALTLLAVPEIAAGFSLPGAAASPSSLGLAAALAALAPVLAALVGAGVAGVVLIPRWEDRR